MPSPQRTRITSLQIQDDSIARNNMHVSTDPDKSVILKVLEGQGIKILTSFDPFDSIMSAPGTGDVTLGIDRTFFDSVYSQLGHTHNVLDLNGFPAITGNSGKFLTTDGATISWTVIDSLQENNFKVGDAGAPVNNATTYTNSVFAGKSIMVFREGEKQYMGDTQTGYSFDAGTGTVTFYPELGTNERISIQVIGSDTNMLSTIIRTLVTATTTVQPAHSYLACDATQGSFILNLTSASAVPNKVYMFKKIDGTANTITIKPNAAETIDGATTLLLNVQWKGAKIISNGASWEVLP